MRTLCLIALLAAAALPVRAEEPPKTRLSLLRTWFKHLKDGLSESSISSYQQKRTVTAVAAVRGEGQESVDPDRPAWKGGSRARRAAALRQERTEFASAVDLILEGKLPEGTAALDAFEKAHPMSGLLPQVAEARQKATELSSPPAGE